ncbi:hypothetical protein BS78_02G233300 [Paspalum vaginatum]|nr:hypothetical protein BS78_02G233300 [Paspalum vaginatum]
MHRRRGPRSSPQCSSLSSSSSTAFPSTSACPTSSDGYLHVEAAGVTVLVLGCASEREPDSSDELFEALFG